MDRRLSILGPVVLSASAVLAQETGPPPVLSLAREEIRPGKGTIHSRSAAAFVAAIARANAPLNRIALVPISGDDNAVVYVRAFGSFADVESSLKQFEEAVAGNAALKTELDRLDREEVDQHASQRTAYYTLRPELSYHPKTAEQTGKARFMSVSTTRIKPGRVPDYVEYIKSLNAAREKTGIDVHTAVYQVATGAANGTFLSFVSMRTLSEVDEARQKVEQSQKALDEALGGAEAVKQRRMLISDIVAEGFNTVYAMDPTLSRPPAQIVAADPDFWTPKPANVKALATKKDTAKPRP